MKEKERGGNETEKKGVKKKVPMRESNPRPLNLQTLKMCCYSITAHAHYDQTSRIYIYIYIANLDCHDLNVSALAPPIIVTNIWHNFYSM